MIKKVDTYQIKHQEILVFSSTDISQLEPQLYKMPAMTKDQWHSGRGWRGRGRGEGREKGGRGEAITPQYTTAGIQYIPVDSVLPPSSLVPKPPQHFATDKTRPSQTFPKSRKEGQVKGLGWKHILWNFNNRWIITGRLFNWPGHRSIVRFLLRVQNFLQWSKTWPRLLCS